MRAMGVLLIGASLAGATYNTWRGATEHTPQTSVSATFFEANVSSEPERSGDIGTRAEEVSALAEELAKGDEKRSNDNPVAEARAALDTANYSVQAPGPGAEMVFNDAVSSTAADISTIVPFTRAHS